MYNLLSGLSVIEASSFVASPTAGLYCAQFGAEVIRVDQIGGGPDYRRWPVTEANNSLYWENLNRAKKSVALDLGRAEGRELLQELVRATGQFITNFPAEGFLSHARLAERRPDLVTVRIMGWADGAPALDYTVNNAVGYPMLTGPGPEPVKLLGSPDGGEYAGQTRFLDRAILASADFSKRVSLGLFDQPQALLLMTDGVSDPYFDTEQQMRDPARWQRLWQDLQAPLAEPAPEAALLDWLNFWSPGNHDDRTLALWRTRPGVAGGALATGPSAAGAEPAADFSYSGLSS